jgi:basic membrane protein A and related proteins
MRYRAIGLSMLFVLSAVAAACTGSSADIKKVGLVTDVGTLEDKSFNEASWVGTQAGAKALGGTASNIVTKAPADYAPNIKTFVDQGYGVIVTVGFAMGDATTIAAKTYPKVKFIGVDQGVCIDETGKSDPTFACKGDAKTLLPNYQGIVFKEEQVGYLAGVLAASVSKTGVIGTLGGINTIPAVVRYINGYRNGAVSVNDKIDVKVAYVSTDITKAFNDPGTGKSIGQQMIGQKADVIFQVAGLSGAGAIEAACATPGVIGLGVDVDQSKSLPQSAKCILTSAEKKLVDAVTAAIGKIGAKTDVGGTSVWDASTTPVGVGLSPYGSDYKDLVTPEIQAKIDAALAGMKAGSVDPCKPTPCDKKD